MRIVVDNSKETFGSEASIADLAQFFNFKDLDFNVFKDEYKHELETSFEDSHGNYFIFKDGSELKVFHI